MALTVSSDPLVWIDCEVSLTALSMGRPGSRDLRGTPWSIGRTDASLTTSPSSVQMTGLDSVTDSIMAIACFITDAQLAMLDEKGFEAVVHVDASKLDQMDDWCTRTHGESGLAQACIDSTVTAEQAASDLLNYIKRHVLKPRQALLAGNSVHADRMFLMKTPWDLVIRYLHYRILDVSAIKEGVRRWSSQDVIRQAPKKVNKHTAREDVLESIEEARYYRTLFQRVNTES